MPFAQRRKRDAPTPGELRAERCSLRFRRHNQRSPRQPTRPAYDRCRKATRLTHDRSSAWSHSIRFRTLRSHSGNGPIQSRGPQTHGSQRCRPSEDSPFLRLLPYARRQGSPRSLLRRGPWVRTSPRPSRRRLRRHTGTSKRLLNKSKDSPLPNCRSGHAKRIRVNLYQERALTKQTRHFASEGPTLQILVGPALAPCRVGNVKNRKVQLMTEPSITLFERIIADSTPNSRCSYLDTPGWFLDDFS
jgi:hypothetical protein